MYNTPVAQLRAGEASDHVVAQGYLKLMIGAGDPLRSLIGRIGWKMPALQSLKVERQGTNLILWDTLKPEVTFKGDRNIVIFGKISKGASRLKIIGTDNAIVVCGASDDVKLTANVKGDHGLVFVGQRTNINSAHIVIGESETPISVMIGARSLLSQRVTLRATDSHGMIDCETRQTFAQPASILIEPLVWLGDEATVLKGARIGAGSVVGAAALVTSMIPRRSVCAGIPARVLRSNVTWTHDANPDASMVTKVMKFLDDVVAATPEMPE